jgi:DNA gyrase subunit A
VSAIRLADDDEVAGMDAITDPHATLLVVTEYGYGKRTPLTEYKVQRRFGSGIRTLSKDLHKTGSIIGASVVTPDDGLTLITAGGIVLRTEVDTISIYGRSTSGVKMIHLADDDALVCMAIVAGVPLEAELAQLSPNGHISAEGEPPAEPILAEDEAAELPDDGYEDDFDGDYDEPYYGDEG